MNQRLAHISPRPFAVDAAAMPRRSPTPVPAIPERPLFRIAEDALVANLVPHPAGTFLTAGHHQFRSLWTRDFCWAVPGLLAIGRADAVRDHLSLLFRNIRETDGQLPRTLDSMNPKLRIAAATLGNALGLDCGRTAPFGALHPEYAEQNGHPVIDGNALAILAALHYVDATRDKQFLSTNAKAIERILGFYNARQRDDLIVQPAFSDWQDSVRRAGKTFYTNILWATVLAQLARRGLFGVSTEQAERVRAKVHATFFDPTSGLYRSLENGSQISLDGNLLAIELGFLHGEDQTKLYEALKQHPLWSRAAGLPGTVTTPDYPPRDRNWTAWVACLGHYHDRVAWSWLMALSAKVAARMGDRPEAERILAGLGSLAMRDNTIVEIYEPERMMRPWQRWLYRSERPFAWGAAMALDAIQYVAATQGHGAATSPR